MLPHHYHDLKREVLQLHPLYLQLRPAGGGGWAPPRGGARRPPPAPPYKARQFTCGDLQENLECDETNGAPLEIILSNAN